MNKLLLRFRIYLENYELDKDIRPKGVLFHRWLPDGRNDAINIPLENNDDELKIWFERKGYVRNGFIAYDARRTDVDTSIMNCQGKLDTGPLIGEAILSDVTQNEMDAIRGDLIDNADYIAVAKRILRSMAYPIINFISILRTKYNQYWLPELNQWDSREMTLGSYCYNVLGLRWSDDNGANWRKFIPTRQGFTLRSGLPDEILMEYLTAEDWKYLQSSFVPNKEPSLASTILSEAHKFCGMGHLRQAFVEGVTALEVALAEFVKRRHGGDKLIEKEVQKFLDIGLSDRFKVAIFGLMTQLISKEAINETIKAINIRNDIAHEGFIPNSNDHIKALKALLKTVATILDDGKYKFPILNSGNTLFAATEYQITPYEEKESNSS